MGRWSASRINDANYCTRRDYLKTVMKLPPLRLSVYVKGGLLHEIIENFQQMHGTEEQVLTKNGKRRTGIPQKYYSADSFAEYVRGRWVSLVIGDERVRNKLADLESGPRDSSSLKAISQLQKKVINWSFKGEPWKIAREIPEICKPLYDRLLEEGPALYSEVKFEFVYKEKGFDDILIVGRIDDVRLRDGKVHIRDYKSGRANLGDMKLKHDPQLTIYNVGLCSLAVNNPSFASALALEERTSSYMGNPIFIDPNFVEEFFMIESLKVRQTRRVETDFYEVIEMIRRTEGVIGSEEIPIPEWGAKCDFCDMKAQCERVAKEGTTLYSVDKNNQRLFSFSSISTHAPKADTKPIKQRAINFKRKKPY